MYQAAAGSFAGWKVKPDSGWLGKLGWMEWMEWLEVDGDFSTGER